MSWLRGKFNAEQLRRGATSKKAYSLLAATSFLESALLPLSVDLIALPMMVGAPKRALMVAHIALLASLAGGVLGYVIGFAFLETLGQWIITTYGLESAFHNFQQQAAENSWAAITAIFLGAVTPIPFKLVCIGAGVLKINLLFFICAAFAGRALRFYAFALAFMLFGPYVRQWAEQNLKWFGLLVVIITALGFVAVIYWPH
jgi:membrane protein YqaA with SNARE-associated domain